MPGAKKNKRSIAAEKREIIRTWLAQDRTLTNEEINKALKDGFGSMVESKVIAEARRDLGIVCRKPNKNAITADDVIVLQKNSEMPPDVLDVASELLVYMRGMGIQHFEIKDDGSLRVKMVQELETVVTK